MSIPKIIVIEGPDASGKTTAVRYVQEALARADVGSWAFHHQAPPVEADDRSAWSRALAFAAQRAHFATAVELGGYDKADVIICDRWWHSTHVEAFRTSNSALGTLAHAEEVALPTPALVIVLDADDHVLDARMTARGEKVTQADRDRRSIYRECAGPAKAWVGREGGSITRGAAPPLVVIDSAGPVSDTARRVATEVLRALGRPVVGWDGDGREVPLVR